MTTGHNIDDWKKGEWTPERVARAFEFFVTQNELINELKDYVKSTALVRYHLFNDSQVEVDDSGFVFSGEYKDIERDYSSLGGDPDVLPDLMEPSPDMTIGDKAFLLASLHHSCCKDESCDSQFDSEPLIVWNELMADQDDNVYTVTELDFILAFQGTQKDRLNLPKAVQVLRDFQEWFAPKDIPERSDPMPLVDLIRCIKNNRDARQRKGHKEYLEREHDLQEHGLGGLTVALKNFDKKQRGRLSNSKAFLEGN